MIKYEIKAIVLIVTILSVISFIESDYFVGVSLLLINVILLIIDSLPQKENYFESEKFLREYNTSVDC